MGWQGRAFHPGRLPACPVQPAEGSQRLTGQVLIGSPHWRFSSNPNLLDLGLWVRVLTWAFPAFDRFLVATSGQGEWDGGTDQLEHPLLGGGGVGDLLKVLAGEAECFSVQGCEMSEEISKASYG